MDDYPLAHGHSDHSASLYFNLYTPGKKIYVPVEIQSIISRFLLSHFELSAFGEEFDTILAGYEVIGVSPGDTWEIMNNGKKTRIKAFQCDHSVPCLSYGVEELKKCLKAEYQGKTGQELGALRKSGISIEDFIWQPCFVYIGDTSERVFEINPSLFEYPCLIVECTFLFEDDFPLAEAKKHCHWNSLSPYIAAHPECFFILYHFSTRYKQEEIQSYFEQEKLKWKSEGRAVNFHAWTHP